MRRTLVCGLETHRLATLIVGLLVLSVGIWLASEITSGHGTCSTHHMYRVYDGTHDRDGDGIGCESLPEPPGGPPSTTTSDSSYSSGNTGYDRDNWSFNSSSARAALMCDSSEHVDHVVALKEAYDSGAANWTNDRKRQFANDRDNLWCLNASVNLSKSDHDLAEWSGGTCEQRQYIANVTVSVKATYSLAIDAAERVAIDIALAAQCSAAPSTGDSDPPPPETSEDTSASTSSTGSGASNEVDTPTADFPAGRIMARRLDDGRVEFAYRPEGEEIILPRKRFFPTTAPVGRWLNSTPIEFDGVEIGRISARLRENGTIEFSFIVADGERILPRQRIFPASGGGRWLRSRVIDTDG